MIDVHICTLMYTLVHSLSVLRRKPGDGDEDDCSRRWAKSGQRASWLHFGVSGKKAGLPMFGERVDGRGSTKENTYPSPNKGGEGGRGHAESALRLAMERRKLSE